MYVVARIGLLKYLPGNLSLSIFKYYVTTQNNFFFVMLWVYTISHGQVILNIPIPE